MSNKLAWGILSTGRIAKAFATGVVNSKTGTLVAVGSRTQAAADAFAAEFSVPNSHGSYEALLADPAVEAVYIAPPHPYHAEWAVKAAEAGKHVLCEKPIGMNHAEAMAIVEAAERCDVFLMEAFMYRCHPQTQKVVELLRNKVIGDVRVIQATFSFDAGPNLQSRLLHQSLGGGGILDVGCYCTSMARLVAGVALGGEIAEPVDVKAVGHLGAESRVDEWTVACLRFPGDIVAQVATGVRVGQENVVRIFGTAGWMLIPTPWIISRDGGTSSIFVYRHGKEPEEVRITCSARLYAIEADTVARHLEQRQAAFPAMRWNDTLGNMRTLDRWREQIGLVYDLERPEGQTHPVHRRPLRVYKDHRMPYGHLPGIDKPISRLVMGVDNQFWLPHATVMFDDFFERGGTCFDTAWIYGRGLAERPLGHWVKSRGVRDKVVIIQKGAHTPWCNPTDMVTHLHESLGWLQMDCVDLYMMHRDNPEIPVSEFIDLLNDWKRKGLVSAFGASNWTIARYEQANAYARAKGLEGFSCLSNNLSLARMVEPPWSGCLGVSDAESLAWLKKTQTPLFAWSSQARGFFVRGNPEDRSDSELVRCWYAEDNFRRLERTRELAARRRCEPIHIALAYVLCQPFPTFPLIGPRALSETVSSFRALDIKLTQDELAWLNLET